MKRPELQSQPESIVNLPYDPDDHKQMEYLVPRIQEFVLDNDKVNRYMDSVVGDLDEFEKNTGDSHSGTVQLAIRPEEYRELSMDRGNWADNIIKAKQNLAGKAIARLLKFLDKEE